VEPGESSAKKRFGAELRAHRTRRGWTQVELGAKIGYSGSYVSDVERGDKGATDDFAKRCDSEDAFDLPGTFLRLWEDLQVTGSVSAPTRRTTSARPSVVATACRSGLRVDPVSATRMTWDASRTEPTYAPGSRLYSLALAGARPT
jgi:transcriptional regulator with XRE-family HTH domain